MANPVRSPEVITSIAFGIFASVLGLAQLVLIFIHRENRSRSEPAGECIHANRWSIRAVLTKITCRNDC